MQERKHDGCIGSSANTAATCMPWHLNECKQDLCMPRKQIVHEVVKQPKRLMRASAITARTPYDAAGRRGNASKIARAERCYAMNARDVHERKRYGCIVCSACTAAACMPWHLNECKRDWCMPSKQLSLIHI